MKVKVKVPSVLLFCLGVAAGGISTASASLLDGMVMHFSLDAPSLLPGDGGVKDSISTGSSATIKTSGSGSLSSVAGLIGGAAYFSPSGSTGNGYIAIDDTNAGNFGTSSFSVSGWFNMPAGVTAVTSLISNGRGAMATPGWMINLTRNSDGNQVMTATFTNATTYPSSIQVSGGEFLFSANSWYHFGLTVNQESGIIILYLNGQQLGSVLTFTAGTSFDKAASNSNTMNIGRASTVGNQWAFTGAMDDIALWSRSLSSSEMNEIYQRGLLGESVAIPEAGNAAATLIGVLALAVAYARYRRRG